MRGLVSVCALLAASYFTVSSTVLPIGKDTYQLSMAGDGVATQANAKDIALQAASNYCAKVGKRQKNDESGVQKQKEERRMELEIAVAVLLILFIYFLPTAIAASRKRHNTGAIFVLNLLLGWSLIGWVVSLVWAVSSDQPPVARAELPNDSRKTPWIGE
jgi:hypothetical protein